MSNRQVTPDILADVLAAEPAPARPTKLNLYGINRSGGTQPRAALDERYIADLVEVLTNGGSLPPVDVTYDGVQYWLHDGFHRWEAHCQAERDEIDAVVHQGDLQAAQWQSYAANQAHGLRRTREDRERAIRAALKHPAGQQLSNREIAKHLGVDDKTIGKYRQEMEQAAQIPQVRERTGGDGKTYTQPVKRLFVNELNAIVTGWVSKHWQREWPENPSHSNGTFWQELTAWLHANRAETWTEADLKTAIKEAHASRPVSLVEEEFRAGRILCPNCSQDTLALNRCNRGDYGQRVDASCPKCGGAWAWIWTPSVPLTQHPAVVIRQRSAPEPQYLTVAQLVEILTPIVAHESAADLRNAATGRDEYYRIPLACQRALYDGPAWRKEDVHATLAAIAEQREPVVSLDDLPVVATTGPVVFVAAPDSPPLPDWVVDEREPEAAPGQIADIAMRVLNLKLWRGSFQMALKNMELWADATGHHTATLEAERGLRRMVEMTDNELAALAA
jgi:hypothetical protein